MITAIDFETALIEPGLQIPPPVCISVASEGSLACVERWPGAEALVVDLLAGPWPTVGANIAFDLAVFCAASPQHIPLVFEAYERETIFDVLIRQKLIDIALGEHRHHGRYDLATVTKRLTGRELAKGEDTWRLRYWELVDVPIEQWPREAIEYSETDALATLEDFQVQENDLGEEGRLGVLVDQHRQSRADFALTLASAWGLRTDSAAVAALRAGCEKRQAELETMLLNAGLLHQKGGKISRRVRAAQEHMLRVCPNARLTDKGKELGVREARYISVDAEACTDSGDPLLEAYGEYAQIGTLISGPLKTLELGVDMPIHTRFEVLLDTGRTSSSNPPLQNLSRKEGVRECFIPRPGWVYVGCDVDKAELHTLAQTCLDLFGHSSLADALNAGYDPHVGLGARLAHTTYDDLKDRVAAGDKTAKEWRQRAKPGNFGFPGGMGPTGMQVYAKSTYGVVMSLAECSHLYSGWQDQWPEVSGEYLDWIGRLTQATGFVTIEHFFSHRWRGRVPYCAAANSFFQGRCADGMKLALWAITKACYLPGSALFGCRVVNEVHDEIIIEAPAPQASDAAWEMQRLMVAEFSRVTPDVPVRSTPVMMNRWSKAAKTIVEDGELKLWRWKA